MLERLNLRSREIFRLLVESYCQTGEAIGSRTLSERLSSSLSPATIRNVLAQLESLGLLYSPHHSAGRLPTTEGLKLFVEGLLEVGSLNETERASLESQCQTKGLNLAQLLEKVSSSLSGLARCASLVIAPKQDSKLKHIEFIPLNPGRALVVLVTEDGDVENRLIQVPLGLPNSVFMEATNYLNARLCDTGLSDVKISILSEIEAHEAELNSLAKQVVEAGLGVWSGPPILGTLIVRGQAHLLEDVEGLDDLERLRHLFYELETRENFINLLDAAINAEGIQIFIGSNNSLFKMAGCSMIVAPYHNRHQQIVGAIGVIGPTRLNYGRIIPMVDYTAQLISRSLS
ncbi:MAG: heat-inducible transcriptional repressor HrcA [Candidatus Paracaedimonas acanthamoebae]|uniref:Heat-inducible transcription repressor HrcA n=1 Tax=Candidatus Paracaedimonas acanthamoebae TaxID=244581 RepID=A0A8J7PJ46_9PROT|nr:heat-inducible transcriptional repressor HrcA [Candidatus Paracaedimonas acanthamoebae]